MPTPSSSESADLLVGAEAIAKFLYGDATKTRRVFGLFEAGQAPIFKFGGRLTARRSTLLADFEQRERSARAQPGEAGEAANAPAV